MIAFQLTGYANSSSEKSPLKEVWRAKVCNSRCFVARQAIVTVNALYLINLLKDFCSDRAVLPSTLRSASRVNSIRCWIRFFLQTFPAPWNFVTSRSTLPHSVVPCQNTHCCVFDRWHKRFGCEIIFENGNTFCSWMHHVWTYATFAQMARGAA